MHLKENARYTTVGFIDSEDSSGNVVLGDWRTIVHGEQGALPNTSTGCAFNSTVLSAKGTKDTFMTFFNSTKGSLRWQKSHINSTGGPKSNNRILSLFRTEPLLAIIGLFHANLHWG